MIPDEETVTLRFKWTLTCKIAVKALCAGLSFEDMCVHALKDYLTESKP